MLVGISVIIVFNFLLIGCGFFMAKSLYNLCKIQDGFWLELLSIGAALLIFLFASAGIILIYLPYSLREFFGYIFLFFLLILNTYLIFSRRLLRDFATAPKISFIFYIGFICLTIASVLLANLPVKLPSYLADGAYVAKTDVLPVRIQYISGNLPADNSVPHVVSEYFLRNISFTSNRPILPGQEVSNRTILMTLVVMPIQASLRMPEEYFGHLPRFSYAGGDWPDFRYLIKDNDAYEITLAVGIILNGLLMLGGAAFLSAFISFSLPLAVVSTFSILSSPYFLFQTLFIWPKSMAGFFIALALLVLIKRRSYLLGGIFAGSAYLCHPYAMVFVGGMVLWVALENIRRFQIRNQNPSISLFQLNKSFVFVLIVVITCLPWVVWTKFYLALPSSDLIEQNFFINGQSFINFIWVRVVNFASSFTPTYFLIYPFNLNQIITSSSVNAVGASGVISYLFFIIYISKLRGPSVYPLIIALAIPSLLLVAIFSNQAVPAVHGLQLPIYIMTILGCRQALTSLGLKFGLTIFFFQIVINFYFLEQYFYRLL
jgi:hypothetical protein